MSKRLTKMRMCRWCQTEKPATAFAWKLDKNGVRKRSHRCAKCWAAQEAKEEAAKLSRQRERRMTERVAAGKPATPPHVWAWRDAPPVTDNLYWTATDTRQADAEWALRFWAQVV